MDSIAQRARRAGCLFRDLLHGALSYEENEIRRIGVPAVPPEHFLSSVAFAPELAIGYLVRKEALRQRVPVEGERQYKGTNKCVDLCLVESGACTASLEIKGPRGVWRPRAPLQEDVLKYFDRNRQIHGAVHSAERCNAWILVAEAEKRPDDMERFVRETVEPLATIEECLVAPPILLNRASEEVLRVGGHDYRELWIVVFRGELRLN